MPDELLQTKLYRPRSRPALVPRPGLLERLNRGLGGKLTLISAPAGFGKTTLISSWLAALPTTEAAPAPPQIAWLSLDENDSAPDRFLAYVIAALQRIDPQIGKPALPLLQASPLPVANVLTTLLNDIAQQPDALMLVLDDYHAVDSQPIDEALTFLLDNLPPQLHLAITSREDPSLPLARLRARGLLTELRASDLRFTVAETAVFLQQVMGLNLTEAQITALEARTEGWIAGLQMAALSMRGQDDLSGFVQSFTGSHRFVLDYLLEEVLQQQPEHVQEFLLKTAVLNRITGSLCDALTGDDDGQEMLEALDRANLFLVPLDNERRWYRYHHLFAELLQQRLPQESEKFDLPDLHIRASCWFADNGQPAEAIHHALAAPDLARAAALIERAWKRMDRRFQGGTWLAWAQQLPAALVRERPVLSAGCAWALLDTGQVEAAEPYLEDAERWLAPDADRTGMQVAASAEFAALPGIIASARAQLAQARRDGPATAHYARRALALIPADDLFYRTIPSVILGLAQWESGDLVAAEAVFTEAQSTFAQVGNELFYLSSSAVLGEIRLAQGRLSAAETTFRDAMAWAEQQGEPLTLATAKLLRGLSKVQLARNELEAMAETLARCQSMRAHGILPGSVHRVHMGYALLSLALGKLDEALDHLDQAEQTSLWDRLPTLWPIDALRALIWLRQGRGSEAEHWAASGTIEPAGPIPYAQEFAALTQARIWLAAYDRTRDPEALAAAFALLDRLQAGAEQGQRQGSLIEVHWLQALAEQSAGNEPAALAALQQAIALAEPEGYVSLFLADGAAAARLLARAAAAGVATDYVNQLRAALAGPAGAPAPGPDTLPDPLSDRELEILTLIASGRKNKEIAATLFVSVNTVHYHTKNLYSKLGVKSRTQAVTRANELNLLA